jgi:hypothetical protein
MGYRLWVMGFSVAGLGFAYPGLALDVITTKSPHQHPMSQSTMPITNESAQGTKPPQRE